MHRHGTRGSDMLRSAARSRTRCRPIPIVIRVHTEDGELLRELTLDPTRDYQPQQAT